METVIDDADLHRVSSGDDFGRSLRARRRLHGLGVCKSWMMSDDDGLGDGFLRSLARRESDMVRVCLRTQLD